MLKIWLIALLFLSIPSPCLAESITEKTSGMEKHDGYVPFYRDIREEKLYLEISLWDTELLYVNSLASGIGSNDIGLDRGQLGRGRIVRFERHGPKVLLIQPNYDYRAETDNPDERRSVEEAFAQSVIWGFTVSVEEGTTALVDATEFFLRDAHDVSGRLKQTSQGDYKIDPTRSAFYLPRTKGFPLNTEVEVTLTFTGTQPGAWVRQVVPSPEAITVRQHHSFVQLPDPGYEPRNFDPRSGYLWISYQDYSTPITEPIVKRFITRHRLQKKNPDAPFSEAVEPIVYYLDRGAPEPVRSALLDGARWWNQAFEAAGFRDAFRVEILPEGADPLDVRYNVIQWVHRATRGWSYGGFIEDPRTGEILKGHVSLGSLRVRQDFLIAEGLVADYVEGREVDPAMLDLALARIRQLSAHEVGHTIGLVHNYIASTAGRASVMDYPHPYVTLRSDSTLDLSQAYAAGIGEWDKVAVAYGYQDFPEGTDVGRKLDGILTDAAGRGLTLISDQDARPPGGAHPDAHLWDNGTNAVDELRRIMAVRSVGIKRFSERNIRPGLPMAMLEDAFVPLYMSHRYQVEAAVKVLGGLRYTYALRGDGQRPTEMIPADEQRRALDALLATISPEALAVPEQILEIIPPRPPGFPRGREHLKNRTSVTFDPIAAASTAAHHTVSLLLDPSRGARLVEYKGLDSRSPGFDEVVDLLLETTWYGRTGAGYRGEIQREINSIVLLNLVSLAMDHNASPQVRGIAMAKISELEKWLSDELEATGDIEQKGSIEFALAVIRQFRTDPSHLTLPKPLDPPDGPPIGGRACDFDMGG